MAHCSNEFRVPPTMKAWVLGGPDELSLLEKPVPEPEPAEVLLRIDAIAVCATDLEIIRHGTPALIEGELLASSSLRSAAACQSRSLRNE